MFTHYQIDDDETLDCEEILSFAVAVADSGDVVAFFNGLPFPRLSLSPDLAKELGGAFLRAAGGLLQRTTVH